MPCGFPSANGVQHVRNSTCLCSAILLCLQVSSVNPRLDFVGRTERFLCYDTAHAVYVGFKTLASERRAYSILKEISYVPRRFE